MDESTSGVVLRTRPLTETSLIVHWLTPDLGRVSTVAKGARRPKSSFAGKLDLFFAADFTFRRSRRSDLHLLHEVRVLEFNAWLRADFGAFQHACYAAALIESATEADTPLASFHELLLGFLAALRARGASPVGLFALEAKVLAECGVLAEPDARKPSAASVILERLRQWDWEQIGRLRLASEQAQAIDRVLVQAWANHLGFLPRGRAPALLA